MSRWCQAAGTQASFSTASDKFSNDAGSRSGDESKPSLRSELARPGDLARSSRRYKPSQKLRDYVSINREDSESLDDKSDTEPGEVPRGESYQARSLPVWRGKRLRSEPKHARPAGVEV